MSVTTEQKIAISEVKGVISAAGEVDTAHAVNQLRNAMEKMVEKKRVMDVETVQFIKPKEAKLKGDYTIVDGFLHSHGEPVAMPGRPDLFVRVVEL